MNTLVAKHPRREAAAPKPAPLPAQVGVTRERIQRRAFELYQARMLKGLPGNEKTDWLAAECELNGKPRADRVQLEACDTPRKDIAKCCIVAHDRSEALMLSDEVE